MSLYIIRVDGEWVRHSEQMPARFTLDILKKFIETIDFEDIQMYKVIE
jgi:hypothetical protein